MAIGLVITVAGCAAQSQPGAAGAPEAATAAAGQPIDPNNPLSQVKTGMTKKQVRDLIGAPSDENSYSTGKAFIPWYYGNDTRRTAWYYKGQGVVVFADGNVFGGGAGGEVVEINADPAESGVAR
jgi:outer membrane protein assembly factor BamE (lipoprotein component of BamABCDE complex)